ncbi:GntR family transcriptional regulator [Sulfitobacter sp. SK011]|uniref:GntR family transcriptional regulator n=1 Tax=Sulfitobacter sp. SK011 TaxID=1389004 RepID=UPI000E0BDBD7|nr:GntR family transcriptional regulator [Sulfitobacter sp. SK011]AXI41635.1 GntR family transcriptional regulator [Sulfitobacter sp. SK011]
MLGWQDVQAEALRRIQSRAWPPGGLIPNEAELATELGCARATVNRALRALAEDGWLERRRRAGTRVALSPQRRAQMSVPVIRQEVEALGKIYGHRVLSRKVDKACLSIQTLHLADTQPYAVEDREINLTTLPAAKDADFAVLSANEWLVQNAPFDRGTMEYLAEAASDFEVQHLGCAPAAPLMILRRETFSEVGLITRLRMAYAPGRAVRLNI